MRVLVAQGRHIKERPGGGGGGAGGDGGGGGGAGGGAVATITATVSPPGSRYHFTSASQLQLFCHSPGHQQIIA